MGEITIWTGAISNIPSGWSLCDGGDGTPDLRDRMVIGAGSNSQIGNTNANSRSISSVDSHSHSSRYQEFDNGGSPDNGEHKSSQSGTSSGTTSEGSTAPAYPPSREYAYIKKL